MSNILTTHVGSLPRSKELSEFLFAKDKGEKFSQSSFDEVLKNNVESVVKSQLDVGIDFVSDGEMSKISYATYIKDRIDGFSGESERRAPADLDDFPEYKEKIAKSGGTPTYTRPCCTNELKVKDETSLLQDINNFKNSLDKLNHRHAFMNSASPGVINVFMPNKFYSTEDEYLDKLSNIMAKEYELITKSDIQVQLDCPDLALARHMNFKNLSEDEFIKRAELQIECLNSALSNVDVEQTRMHICWGNYEGPHICDISMDSVFSTLMSVNADYLLFETSNPRHAHEWKIFESRKHEIPENKILIPGVIDSTTNFVEHPELIAQRLERFINIVGRERVIAGSDCGFGTFAGFGAVDPEIAFAKLESLSKGAAIASE